MVLFGKFLTYKQRRAKPRLPKKYKNRFLRRHSGFTGTLLRYFPESLKKKSLRRRRKSRRVRFPRKKINQSKYPKLSFFLDMTFLKPRVELSIYNNKKAAIVLAANKLAKKKQRKANQSATNLGPTVPIKSDTYYNNSRYRLRRYRTRYITTYRGVKIRKKVIRRGRDLQKEVVRAFKGFKKKNKYDKPLQDFESFSSSANNIMLDWLMGLGFKDSLLLGKSRVFKRYKLVKLKIRRRRFRRRRRRIFIKIRQFSRKANLKRRLRLSVSNYVNPWFLNKLAQYNYKFKNNTYNLFSVYNSIICRFKSVKSYTTHKDTIILPPRKPFLYKFERCPFFKFNSKLDSNIIYIGINVLPYTYCSGVLSSNNSAYVNLLGFSKKMPKLLKINKNTFLWIVMKLIKMDTFVFSNSNLIALLGVLPSFYLYKAVRRSDNRFLQCYYKSNYVLPNLNLIKIRKLKKNKKNKNRIKNVYGGYSLFLGAMLTSWLESPASVVVLNLKVFFVNLAKSKLLNTLVRKNIRFHYKVGTGFFIREAVQVILLSLSLKDPILLMNWLTKIMEKVQFFKHKNYIMFFKSIFNDLNRGILRRIGMRGLYFDIRGKLGVKGDAKKRHVLLRYGECTFSQKSIKISPAYGLVHTFTGVLGVTLVFFF